MDKIIENNVKCEECGREDFITTETTITYHKAVYDIEHDEYYAGDVFTSDRGCVTYCASCKALFNKDVIL